MLQDLVLQPSHSLSVDVLQDPVLQPSYSLSIDVLQSLYVVGSTRNMSFDNLRSVRTISSLHPVSRRDAESAMMRTQLSRY